MLTAAQKDIILFLLMNSDINEMSEFLNKDLEDVETIVVEAFDAIDSMGVANA